MAQWWLLPFYGKWLAYFLLSLDKPYDIFLGFQENIVDFMGDINGAGCAVIGGQGDAFDGVGYIIIGRRQLLGGNAQVGYKVIDKSGVIAVLLADPDHGLIIFNDLLIDKFQNVFGIG